MVLTILHVELLIISSGVASTESYQVVKIVVYNCKRYLSCLVGTWFVRSALIVKRHSVQFAMLLLILMTFKDCNQVSFNPKRLDNFANNAFPFLIVSCDVVLQALIFSSAITSKKRRTREKAIAR